MIKSIEQKIIIYEVYCDICGKIICSSEKNPDKSLNVCCTYCDRHICSKCRRIIYNKDIIVDYSCSDCEPYLRDKLMEEDKIKKIYEEQLETIKKKYNKIFKEIGKNKK